LLETSRLKKHSMFVYRSLLLELHQGVCRILGNISISSLSKNIRCFILKLQSVHIARDYTQYVNLLDKYVLFFHFTRECVRMYMSNDSFAILLKHSTQIMYQKKPPKTLLYDKKTFSFLYLPFVLKMMMHIV